MTLTIAAVFIPLLLSAFFSASETALSEASRPLMHHLDKRGNRRAGIVNRLDEKYDRLLGTILVGKTLVNILASSLATSAMIAVFGLPGVAYATLTVTLLLLIVGEILPRSYAVRRANQVALGLAPTVHILVQLLAPLTHSIELLVRGLLRLSRRDVRVQSVFVPIKKELRSAITLHGGGTTDSEIPSVIGEERAMLHSVLDLAELQVGEVMTHGKNVVMIDVNDPPQAVVAQVVSSPYTRFPLWRTSPDNVVGVIHAKALLRAVQSRGGRLDTLDVIEVSSRPWFVPESTTLIDQLRQFRERREHFALVVDEYGSLMGIVTLEGILEEIVGDIADEHDVAMPGVVRQADGSFVVQGAVTIRELQREFGWPLPDDAAVTIAGLVLHEARRIPDVGQIFLFHDFRFEVLARQRNQITVIRLSPPAAAATGEEE